MVREAHKVENIVKVKRSRINYGMLARNLCIFTAFSSYNMELIQYRWSDSIGHIATDKFKINRLH